MGRRKSQMYASCDEHETGKRKHQNTQQTMLRKTSLVFKVIIVVEISYWATKMQFVFKDFHFIA